MEDKHTDVEGKYKITTDSRETAVPSQITRQGSFNHFVLFYSDHLPILSTTQSECFNNSTETAIDSAKENFSAEIRSLIRHFILVSNHIVSGNYVCMYIFNNTC